MASRHCSRTTECLRHEQKTLKRNLRIYVHCLYTVHGTALSPRHDAFPLVAKIAENSSKLSDFEEKRSF